MSEEPRVLAEEERLRFFAEMLQDMPHPGYFPPLGEGGPLTYTVLFLASLAAGGIAFYFAIGFRLG